VAGRRGEAVWLGALANRCGGAVGLTGVARRGAVNTGRKVGFGVPRGDVSFFRFPISRG